MLIKVPKQSCNYCTKLTDELIIFSGNVRFCPKCWEHHLKILAFLSGQGPALDACQICNLPIFELMEATGQNSIKMAIVQKDGIYQYACKPCAAKYNPKRQDLFKGTAAEGLYAR